MVNAQSSMTTRVRDYYNGKQEDRNLLLAAGTGIINHHFGIGDFDRSVLPQDLSQDQILKIIHELELKQIEVLMDVMGTVEPNHKILDAGCGRGGTAFTLAQRFGCSVEAITISAYQKEFCEQLAQTLGLQEIVNAQLMDYLQLNFVDGSFDHVITNETTLYAKSLEELFRGFYRALKLDGRYTLATWCVDKHEPHEFIEPINDHYHGRMHSKEEYICGLEAVGFKNIQCRDLTEDAIPYWEIRNHWSEKSGIEDAFLATHRERRVLYLYITAEK